MSRSNADELLEELREIELEEQEEHENADELFIVSRNDLNADYAELNQRLTVLYRKGMNVQDRPDLLREIDMRPDLLQAYGNLCRRPLRLEGEVDFGDIAAALSYRIRFQAYKGVMISFTYAQIALPLVHHLMETKEGKRLLRRVRSTFEILFQEEPELIRELGWEIL